MSCLAIIPARGGSKRIKNKNIKLFCGLPIIRYSIDVAINSGLFDEIHISTESQEIASVVADIYRPIEAFRPETLAKDEVPLMSVLQYVVGQYKRVRHNFETVVLLFPCAPLLTVNVLKDAYKEFVTKKYSEMLSVSRTYLNARNSFSMSTEMEIFTACPGNMESNGGREDIRYCEAGQFVFYRGSFFEDVRPVNERERHGYVLSSRLGIDINTYDDWTQAESIYLQDRIHDS